jgi:hypothetical protein
MPGVSSMRSRLRQHADRLGEARAVVRAEAAAPDQVGVDLPLRSRDVERDLVLRHLEAEDRDADARVVLGRHAPRDVERERRLADARPRGEHDHLPPLQAGELVVELGEARADALELAPLLEPEHHLAEHRPVSIDRGARRARRGAPRRITCSALSISSSIGPARASSRMRCAAWISQRCSARARHDRRVVGDVTATPSSSRVEARGPADPLEVAASAGGR